MTTRSGKQVRRPLKKPRSPKKLRKRSLPLMNTSNGVLLLEHDNNTKKHNLLSSTNELEDGSVTKVTCYIMYHLVSTNICQYHATIKF